MKEKRTFKRFDLIAALAVLGVLLVLLFESFFIFELYRVDYGKIESYLPAFVKEWLATAPVEAAAEEIVLPEETPQPTAEQAEPAEKLPVPVGDESAPAEDDAPPSEGEELSDPEPVG